MATKIELPRELLRQAMIVAIAQSQRAYKSAQTKYGPNHVLTQTLQQEWDTLNKAISTLQDVK